MERDKAKWSTPTGYGIPQQPPGPILVCARPVTLVRNTTGTLTVQSTLPFRCLGPTAHTMPPNAVPIATSTTAASPKTSEQLSRITVDRKLYFIRETKSTLDSEERRSKENQKIACGCKHFEAIGVNFDVMTSSSEVNFKHFSGGGWCGGGRAGPGRASRRW